MDWYAGIIVAKDPDGVIDWRWEWEDWLSAGDSISSHTATPAVGITVDSSTINGTGIDVVLSGGTAGTSYDVTVQITTAAGLVDDRTVTLEVAEK